jgi:hypothetical protein
MRRTLAPPPARRSKGDLPTSCILSGTLDRACASEVRGPWNRIPPGSLGYRFRPARHTAWAFASARESLRQHLRRCATGLPRKHSPRLIAPDDCVRVKARVGAADRRLLRRRIPSARLPASRDRFCRAAASWRAIAMATSRSSGLTGATRPGYGLAERSAEADDSTVFGYKRPGLPAVEHVQAAALADGGRSSGTRATSKHEPRLSPPKCSKPFL